MSVQLQSEQLSSSSMAMESLWIPSSSSALQAGKKRRLTAAQVEFLERSFEVGNKLESERKFQLARQLGLQPRQVAIWFQNRRARSKNKQLEKDYDLLRASFDKLISTVSSRKKMICKTRCLNSKRSCLLEPMMDLKNPIRIQHPVCHCRHANRKKLVQLKVMSWSPTAHISWSLRVRLTFTNWIDRTFCKTKRMIPTYRCCSRNSILTMTHLSFLVIFYYR